MTDGEVKVMRDYEGPSRESAQDILKQQVTSLRTRADGLEAILKKLGDEVGTPAECEMWSMLCKTRGHC